LQSFNSIKKYTFDRFHALRLFLKSLNRNNVDDAIAGITYHNICSRNSLKNQIIYKGSFLHTNLTNQILNINSILSKLQTIKKSKKLADHLRNDICFYSKVGICDDEKI